MIPQTIILASGSPRRQELLHQIGIIPIIQPSHVEEVMISDIPEEVVVDLSVQKAVDVAASCPVGSVILGADTVVAVDGVILGKPSSHAQACEMIGRLQGKTHQVYTGVTLIVKEEQTMQRISFYEVTDVVVYPMAEAEILAYAESEEPMDKAGAYAIQGQFAAYIQ